MARHIEGCDNSIIHETKKISNYSLISVITIM
jgi:hypothetical protein